MEYRFHTTNKASRWLGNNAHCLFAAFYNTFDKLVRQQSSARKRSAGILMECVCAHLWRIVCRRQWTMSARFQAKLWNEKIALTVFPLCCVVYTQRCFHSRALSVSIFRFRFAPYHHLLYVYRPVLLLCIILNTLNKRDKKYSKIETIGTVHSNPS